MKPRGNLFYWIILILSGAVAGWKYFFSAKTFLELRRTATGPVLSQETTSTDRAPGTSNGSSPRLSTGTANDEKTYDLSYSAEGTLGPQSSSTILHLTITARQNSESGIPTLYLQIKKVQGQVSIGQQDTTPTWDNMLGTTIKRLVQINAAERHWEMSASSLPPLCRNALQVIADSWMMPSEVPADSLESWSEDKSDLYGLWHWEWAINRFGGQWQTKATPVASNQNSNSAVPLWQRQGQWDVTWADTPLTLPAKIQGTDHLWLRSGDKTIANIEAKSHWQESSEQLAFSPLPSVQNWTALSPALENSKMAAQTGIKNSQPQAGDMAKLAWDTWLLPSKEGPQIARYLEIRRSIESGSADTLRQCAAVLRQTEPNPGLYRDVLGALATAAGKEGKNTLMQHLSHEAKDPNRVVALLPLLAQGDQFHQEAAAYVQETARSHPDPAVRSTATLAVGSMIKSWSSSDPQGAEQLLEQLVDSLKHQPTAAARIQIINALGNSGHSSLVETLAPYWAPDSPSDVQVRAIFALRNVPTQEAESTLASLISTGNSEARAAAANALRVRNINEANTIAALLRSYQQADDSEEKATLRQTLVSQRSRFRNQFPELDKF